MLYGLLGELEIRKNGQLMDLPGGHALTVLAALLVNANRRMSKAELLRAAWGTPDVQEAQLHKSATTLRTLLTELGRADHLVTHPRFGYEMRVPDDDLDMLQFQRFVKLADEAAAERHTDDEIDQLRAALRLWRGPRPLANVASDAFRRETDGLEQRRKRAAVRLFDLEIARGGYDRVVDELILIAGYHPTDRRLCEQLMVVLYRCGHSVDAIRAYERFTDSIDQAIGGAPDKALRDLNYAIAGGNESAIAALEFVIAQRAGTAGGGAVAIPRQLPPEPAGFVGRDNLAAEASWLLGRQPDRVVPVVVISGPGGIGKTALARRVAHQVAQHYTDGQLHVELRGTSTSPEDPSEVLAQFLRGLGVMTVPETRGERAALYRTLLADRRVLIVLDDAADGAQVADLIPANPGCGVLVTARQRLPELSGAHHVAPLEPLDPVPATALFLGVVAGGGIEIDDIDAVADVVALCGGLPLALRIAGALRVHDAPRSTAELADRLVRQGPEALAFGEHSVARTIGAGFDRLDDDARRLFLGLGLLRLPRFGPWTAAAVLPGSGVDTTAVLSRLAAGNMIEPIGSEVRFRFHDLTKEYAHRRALAEHPGEDERQELCTNVYRALLTLARRAHAALYGGDFEVVHSDEPNWYAPAAVLDEVGSAPLDWFERERLNIRAAVEHCAELGLHEIAWDLAVSSHEFYGIGGYFDDWHATHTAALRACRLAGDRRGEGIVLACLGQPALVASRRAGASGPPELERAIELLAGAHDKHGQAIAQRTLANALRRAGHLARPLGLFVEALANYEASGDTVGRWQTLRFIGQTHLDLGDADRALETLRTAEAGALELGKQRPIAQSRYWIGQALLVTEELDAARDAFTAVREVYPAADSVGHAYAAHGLGDVAWREGANEAAQQHLGVAAGLARDGADAVLEGRVYLSSAAMYAAADQPGQQISALEQAITCFAEAGQVYLEVRALAALAATHDERGAPAAADAAWTRVEHRYKEMAIGEEDRIHRRPAGGTA